MPASTGINIVILAKVNASPAIGKKRAAAGDVAKHTLAALVRQALGRSEVSG